METRLTSQGHLPFEQVEGDIHGNTGVCRHGRRLPVSWHVTINACQKTEHVMHSPPAVSVYYGGSFRRAEHMLLTKSYIGL